MVDIGKNIAILRKQHNMSQGALAEKLFVTPQAVSRWERSETQPDVDTIKKIAQIFGVTVEEVVEGTVSGLRPVVAKRLRIAYLLTSIIMIFLSVGIILTFFFETPPFIRITFICLAIVYLIWILLAEIYKEVKRKKSNAEE